MVFVFNLPFDTVIAVILNCRTEHLFLVTTICRKDNNNINNDISKILTIHDERLRQGSCEWTKGHRVKQLP